MLSSWNDSIGMEDRYRCAQSQFADEILLKSLDGPDKVLMSSGSGGNWGAGVESGRCNNISPVTNWLIRKVCVPSL
jgi:hypothetical protein